MSPVLLVFMDLTGAKSQIFMKNRTTSSTAVCTCDRPPVKMREPQKRSINPISTSALFIATSAATTTASHGVKRIRPMDSPV